MGRRFAYNADGLVSSILSDEQYALDDNVQALEIAYMGTATGVMAPCRLFVFDVTLDGGVSITTMRASNLPMPNSPGNRSFENNLPPCRPNVRG